MFLQFSASALAASLATNTHVAAAVVTVVVAPKQVLRTMAGEEDKAAVTVGAECRPSRRARNDRDGGVDIGLLGECDGSGEVCVDDQSSSLGGRCRLSSPLPSREARRLYRRREQAKANAASQTTRQRQPDTFRFLQDESDKELDTCPEGCDATLCECVENNSDSAHHFSYDCAPELSAVCNAGTIGNCVSESSVNRYDTLYCPFAQCVVDGGTFLTCFCEYYQDSCSCEYYQALCVEYPQAEYCGVAECCEQQTTDNGRLQCLAWAPSKSPSDVPSSSPTSSPPTVSNQLSHSPTISSEPTVSMGPSSSPTTLPTVSAKLSDLSTETAPPSLSMAPSNQPTTSSPIPAPSKPTSSAPTKMPATKAPTTSSINITLPPVPLTSSPTSSPTTSPVATSTMNPTGSPVQAAVETGSPVQTPVDTGSPVQSPPDTPASGSSRIPSSWRLTVGTTFMIIIGMQVLG